MFTNHLTEEQLYQHIIDKHEMSIEESLHLRNCGHCTHRASSVSYFLNEMSLVRRSQPSRQAIQNYNALFAYVKQQRPGHVVADLWEMIKATLLRDSREEALAGLRSANAVSYRLLYTTERADIELLVEPSSQGRRLEGEILTLEQTESLTPALLQLQREADHEILYETECNDSGRFQFDDVQPNQYQLYITPLQGAAIQVETLNIT